MYKPGQIITIPELGKFRIEVSRIGCMDCHSVKNDIDEEPCVTCARISKEMCNSNIKLVKVFEGDLDNFLKYHNEHSDL